MLKQSLKVSKVAITQNDPGPEIIQNDPGPWIIQNDLGPELIQNDHDPELRKFIVDLS
jgi:hypothetical protein